MSFFESISKAKLYLQEHGRVSLRSLKREFKFDDEQLDELVDELVNVQQFASRQGDVISWANPDLQEASAPDQSDEITDTGIGDRRQATVMFSDLSGYTSLNERLDPEDVELLVQNLKAIALEVVEAHGGTVNQFVGDEILALFGIPLAHSDDPLRAARAAWELHRRANELFGRLEDKKARDLRMHTGIATGMVLAMVRDKRDGNFSVTSDTVNIAARLRSLAGPDEIWVNADARLQVQIEFDLESISLTSIKGRSETITPYRVHGIREPGSVARQTSFVGRRRELKLFDVAAKHVCDESNGEVLYLRGEAGIGKTRLVEECQRKALKQHNLVSHKALVLNFGSATGRDALRALLWSLLGIGSEESIERRRDIAANTAIHVLADVDALAFLNELLDVPQAGEAQATYDAMDSSQRERGFNKTAANLVKALARKHPLMLIVEDLHWASETLLRRLALLTASLHDSPVLLMMTSRIEGDPLDAVWRSSAGEIPVSTVDLKGIKHEDALKLATEYLDKSHRTAEACITRAEGNPLFLEQLLQTADETGTTEALPGSIQSVVLARLDLLPAIHKSALQSASILGQRFSLEALRYLINSPEYSCELAIKNYLVRPEAGDLIFSHALIQQGFLESLLHSRARELHRRAAGWYAEHDPSLHAQHLERAGDDGAATAYLRAAEEQMLAYRYDEAAALAAGCIRVARLAGERSAANCLQGEIHNNLGSATDALQSFEEALQEADTAKQRCKARLGIAASLRTLERLNEAFPILEVAQKEAKQANLYKQLSQLFHLEGNLHFPLGNLDACVGAHKRALEYAQRANSPDCEAEALGGLADGHWVSGRVADAYRNFLKTVTLAQKHGFGRIEVANKVMVAYSLMYLDPSRADEIFAISAEARNLAEKVHNPRALLLSTAILPTFATEFRHNNAGVEEQIIEAGKIINSINARRFLPFILNAQGRLAYRKGDYSSSVEFYRQSVEVARETGIGFMGPACLAGLARSERDPGRARANIEEAENIIKAGCVGHNQLATYRDAIYVYLEQHNWDEATRFTHALDDFRDGADWPHVIGIVARARALIRYGQGDRTAGLLAHVQELRVTAGNEGIWEPGFELMQVEKSEPAIPD